MILSLFLLIFSSCSPPKLRSDGDLLGLVGPVKTLEISYQAQGMAEELLEIWDFDDQGRLTSRQVFSYHPFAFHPYFLQEKPGIETYTYDPDGRIKFILREGEREEFFIRPGARVFESDRRDLRSVFLGRRSFERDYKGNLLGIKVIGPQDQLQEYQKVDNYKIGRPFEVVLSLPDSQGELNETRVDRYEKDGLIQTQKGLRTGDEKGNWVKVALDNGGFWVRKITYYASQGEKD